MSRGKRWIIFMLYLCFCFPALTKWRDCSSGTHKEKHTEASFPELITEGRPFLCSVLSFSCVFMSLSLFIFTTARTLWASHLLFAWLGVFSPPFFCVFFSILDTKGKHSLEVNHAPQTQAPNHVWLCRRTSFPFLISDPNVLLWEFLFGLISNLHTFPRKTQQEACLQKRIIRQGQTWCIKHDLTGS